jgi:hypothetical protein
MLLSRMPEASLVEQLDAMIAAFADVSPACYTQLQMDTCRSQLQRVGTAEPVGTPVASLLSDADVFLLDRGRRVRRLVAAVSLSHRGAVVGCAAWWWTSIAIEMC